MRAFNRIFSLSLAFVLAFALASNVQAQDKNLVEVAVGNDDFSTLVTAVTEAGLAETLASGGPFTILAPTNAAFAKIPEADLKAILADRGQQCRGCAEKADYVAMAADVWSLPIVEKPASGDETKEKPAEPDLNDADQERIRRMMDEMQNGPRPTGDPERDAILKKLHSSGIKFSGGEGMPLDQLRNLEKAMGNIKTKKQGDGDDEL